MGVCRAPEERHWFPPDAEDLARAAMLTMMEECNYPDANRAEAPMNHYNGLRGIVFQEAPDFARRPR
jgi:hypothetical protein